MAQLRIAAAVLLAIVLGFIGLSMVFSDLGPGETLTWRVGSAVALFLIGGAAVGFLAGRYWPMALLIAWGSTLMGILVSIAAIRRVTEQPPSLWIGVLILLGPLALALIGGFLGSRLAIEKDPPL